MFCEKNDMTRLINLPVIMKVLDWAYEKTLNGIPGMETVDEMAQKFTRQDGTMHEKVNSLIRWQNAKAGASGFVTGLGGFMTLPVGIPANLASVLFIQIRMIAAIARMGGYDLRDEKVKMMVYLCLAGNFAKDIIQETGIIIGTKLTASLIERVSERSLLAVNQRVGFRLLTNYGEKGVVNIGKVIPLAGGVIGGTIDLVATNIIGNTARKIFIGTNIKS